MCAPGATFCASPGQRARCSADGTSFTVIGNCPQGTGCDPDTVLCKAIVCAAGEIFCPEPATPALCGEGGTGFDLGAPCAAGEGCGPAGCAPWICTPESLRCTEDGRVARCLPSGLDEQLFAPCEAPPCATCVGKQVAATCEGEVATATACDALWRCFPGKGCGPLGCDAVFEGCAGASPPDGCSRLVACVPPPPPVEAGGFTASPDDTALKVSFSAGLDDAGAAYVTLAPVVNPQTGLFLEDLTPRITVGDVAIGDVTVREDGVAVELACGPLTDTPWARTDLVFVIDVTGSMQPAIGAVLAGVQDLAVFLAASGLDMTFGAVTFRDETVGPQNPLAFRPLTADIVAFKAFLAQQVATAGGDVPENALDALAAARDHMAWRPGAQRVMVLITDAVMHIPKDGSGYTKTDPIALVASLERAFTVHSISRPIGDSVCYLDAFPDARLLSCATGGTAARLADFVKESAPIRDALFARALAQTTHCTFASADPSAPHDVEVEITRPFQGLVLSGSALQAGLVYAPP